MVVWYRFAAKYDELNRASATGLRGKRKLTMGFLLQGRYNLVRNLATIWVESCRKLFKD